MSDVSPTLTDGDVIDCCAEFISKRVVEFDGDRVTIVTLSLAGERCHLVLCPSHRSVVRGWRVGDSRYLRTLLVCCPDEEHSVDRECPECQTALQSRTVIEHDEFNDSLREAVSTIAETPVLVATRSTSVDLDCPSESPWQETKNKNPDVADRSGAECPECGRTFQVL